jgi:lantibiotic modifying enzyme
MGESAFRLADATVRRARRNGGYRLLPGFAAGPFVPSFFQGLSGIGYTLLRLAHPGDLPDVLVLE